MDRWKRIEEARPPLDRWGRCEDLWLYDAAGADVVYRGFYVETGDEEAASLAGKFSHEGQLVKPTHWTVIHPGEHLAPAPPYIR